MGFRERSIAHLIDYKKNILKVQEEGFWKRNNTRYAHILPEERMNLNLLEGYRSDLWTSIRNPSEPIHLHKDFHHLNSSQALCLNFFYPLIADRQMHLLLEMLHYEDGVYEYGEFEKVSSIDGTNFDFYMQLESADQLFFEIKYTENGFGKVQDSEKYRRKYEEVYKEQLAGKIRPGVDEYSVLLDNYQLLRNISYVDAQRDDLLIIICPKGNVKLHQEFEHVMDHVIVPELHDKIRLLTWETMLRGLTLKIEHISNLPSRFVEHYVQFGQKYLFS